MHRGSVLELKSPLRFPLSVLPHTQVGTKDQLKASGRMVVEVSGSKILVVEEQGEVYAVSNKCSHLGLPLQGKILSAPVANGCVTCAAHNTSFDLKTGAVVGEWCPKLPSLPVVGKIGGNDKKPLVRHIPTQFAAVSRTIIRIQNIPRLICVHEFQSNSCIALTQTTNETLHP